MAHAIIRGANGRRHDVEFEGAGITIDIFFGDDTVEIAVEAPQDPVPSEKRRFALPGAVQQGSGRRCAALEESARGDLKRGKVSHVW